eukprot:gnl/MRDRNA2_/MRDRNA2_182678_c0_seq1.p1 gnl/MRDRNA2_/MRDRNA2_182678_c0~~gnl/MRDRNA2_/MRDRNA2_182678_c0_seq1.p1  ORF type:complete len:105 (+),score=26.91 gnl/MRDRNA2_/MRDRNA2_182678_c0_seq1:106-420(+)
MSLNPISNMDGALSGASQLVVDTVGHVKSKVVESADSAAETAKAVGDIGRGLQDIGKGMKMFGGAALLLGASVLMAATAYTAHRIMLTLQVHQEIQAAKRGEKQ